MVSCFNCSLYSVLPMGKSIENCLCTYIPFVWCSKSLFIQQCCWRKQKQLLMTLYAVFKKKKVWMYLHPIRKKKELVVVWFLLLSVLFEQKMLKLVSWVAFPSLPHELTPICLWHSIPLILHSIHSIYNTKSESSIGQFETIRAQRLWYWTLSSGLTIFSIALCLIMKKPI